MRLVVGRVGHAHGVRGEVSVEVRTDDPERRFAAGSRLGVDRDGIGALTVHSVRPHSGRLLVKFDEVSDRPGAQALRGALLDVDSESSSPAPEGEWWDHDLVGLRVETTTGMDLGRVTAVIHAAFTATLAVEANGRELLVPFVEAIVPTVDVAAGRIVVDPPDGLLDL